MGGGVVVSGVLVCLHLRCMVFFLFFFGYIRCHFW